MMLSLDRFDAGELSTAMCERVIDHLDRCDVCAERIEQMRRAAQELTISPPEHLAAAKGVSGRWTSLGMLAGVSVAAAVLLLAVLPTAHRASRESRASRVPAEELTASAYSSSSSAQDMARVHRSLDVSLRTPAGTLLTGGERVLWGETLHIELQPARGGLFAVLVVTDSFDQADGTGGLDFGAEVTVLLPMTRLEPSARPTTIEYVTEAVAFGAQVGERVFVLHCSERMELDLLGFDPEQPLPAECTSREFELTRYGEVADS